MDRWRTQIEGDRVRPILLQNWTNPIAKIGQGVFPGHAPEGAILATAHRIKQAIGVISNLQKLSAFRADKTLANGMRVIRADVGERSRRIFFNPQSTMGFADSAKCPLYVCRFE